MQRKLYIPGALAAVLALTACDQSATGSDDTGLSPAEIQEIAAEVGSQDAAALGSFGNPTFNAVSADGEPAFATTVTNTFTITRTCPQGGNVTIQGTRTHTFDRAARSASHEFNATRTENACAFNGRREGVVITLNGNPNTVLTGNHAVVNGVPGIGTATKKGSFTWSKSTGQSGTCNIDLTSTWDPATKTFTLKGTFCNRTVDITRTWRED